MYSPLPFFGSKCSSREGDAGSRRSRAARGGDVLGWWCGGAGTLLG